MQDDGSKPLPLENLQEILMNRSGLYKGTINIFLVHCQHLVDSDGKFNNTNSGNNNNSNKIAKKDVSDPFVLFKVPGGKEIKTKEIENSLSPVWETVYSTPINMPKNMIQPLRVEVLDKDLIGDDLLGYASVDLSKCLQNPQKWAINHIQELSGDQDMKKKYKVEKFGEIYFQIMYVIDGYNLPLPEPEPLLKNLGEKQRLEKEIGVQPMKGMLLVNIISARDIIPGLKDKKITSSYCKLTFPNDKKSKTQECKKGNQNPIWHYSTRYELQMTKKDYIPLKFEIYSSQGTFSSDYLIGSVEIDWMESFEKPEKQWQINGMYKIKNAQKINSGEIYVQVLYLDNKDALLLDKVQKQVQSTLQSKQTSKVNIDDINLEEEIKGKKPIYPYPPTPETLQEDYGRIAGNLEISIKSALNLKNADFGGKSDPFVVAYLSEEPGNKIKTEVQLNNLNPIWDFTGNFYVNCLRSQIKDQQIILQIYDEDNLSSELIGTVHIPIIEALEIPITENQEYTVFDELKPDSKTNLGTLVASYRWKQFPYCESITGLREPEEQINGFFKINIINCKNLNKEISNSSVEFYISNQISTKYKNSKVKGQDPEFNFSKIIPIKIGKRKYTTLKSIFQIKNHGMISTSVYGGFNVNLQDRIDNPGQWYNEYVQIISEKSKDDSNNQQQYGYCYIQICYLDSQKELEEMQVEEKNIKDFQSFINEGKPPTILGELFINIVGANKIPTSCLDKSDPFVTININKGNPKKIQTKTIDDNLTPEWRHQDTFILDLQEEEYKNIILYCKLYDYDFASNDLLGQTEINISKLFESQNKKEWINQKYALLDPKNFPGAGELYLQIQWRPKDIKYSEQELKIPTSIWDKEITQKNQNKIKLQEEHSKQKAQVKGNLFIKVIQAYNIKKADTFSESDGIITLKINEGSKEMLKTQEIENQKNPIFNKELIYQNIQIPVNNQEDYQKNGKPPIFKDILLSATIEDADPEGNDFLGYVKVSLDYILNNPGIWDNEIRQICDSKGIAGQSGLLYMMIQWRPEKNRIDIDQTLPLQKSIEEDFYKGCKPKGTVIIKVVGGKNIIGFKKNGTQSDSKLKLTFFNNSEKTSVQKATINPTWNETFNFKIDFPDRSMFPFLKCELLNNGTFTDDFLGDFECNISSILEKVDVWSIKKEYPLANLTKKNIKQEIKGSIELHIAFVGQSTPLSVLDK